VPRADGEPVPLSQDLGRAFLYARYDATLTKKGLDAIDCADINPDDVSLLDSVAHMAALERVGGGVAARQVDISAFGPFLDA
jgi:hypothetical protein